MRTLYRGAIEYLWYPPTPDKMHGIRRTHVHIVKRTRRLKIIVVVFFCARKLPSAFRLPLLVVTAVITTTTPAPILCPQEVI